MDRQAEVDAGIKDLAIARNAIKRLQARIEAGRNEAREHKDGRYPVLAQMDADCNSALGFIEKICADSFKLQGDDITIFGPGGK